MLLYHGTSGSIASKIQSEGIFPRGDQLGQWKCESRPDLVYLTSGYAPYYAINAAREEGIAAVVEVDVDEDFLLPDEDFLGQAVKGQDICPVDGLEDRTAWFRDRLDDFKHHWIDSLNGLGTVAYEGLVSVGDIERISYFDIHKHPQVTLAMEDPMITIMNHRFLREKNEALTAVSMGDEFSIDRFLFGLAEVVPEARQVWQEAMDGFRRDVQVWRPKRGKS